MTKSFDKGHAKQTEDGAKKRAVARPAGSNEALLSLQRASGNRAVTGLLGEGSGKPLPAATRQEMESKFGADFGDVRVHTGDGAAKVALGVGARAITSGKDIVFGEGFYAPSSSAGKRLIAHELAHVVQQNRTSGRNASAASAESEARQAGSDVAGGHAATVAASAAGAQADPMTKEEIEKAIADKEAKAASSSSREEADKLFQERNALLEKLKTAAPAAAPVVNQPPPAAPPPPPLSKEEQQKASDAEALRKAGITAEQLKDYAALPHGDVMDKYGFFNFWKIRSAARSLPGGVVSRTLPQEDPTLYWQASGRVATNADEKRHQLAEKIENFHPPTGTGAILMTGGYIAGAKPETIQGLQALGDNLEGVAGGVAAVGQARAANRGLGRSAVDSPRGGPVTQEPPKVDEVVKEPPASGPNTALPKNAPANAAPPPPVVSPAPPPARTAVSPPPVRVPGGTGRPANDVTPPKEPQSNVVPLFPAQQQPAENQEPIKVAAGQDFRGTPTVASGSKKTPVPAATAPRAPVRPEAQPGVAPKVSDIHRSAKKESGAQEQEQQIEGAQARIARNQREVQAIEEKLYDPDLPARERRRLEARLETLRKAPKIIDSIEKSRQNAAAERNKRRSRDEEE